MKIYKPVYFKSGCDYTISGEKKIHINMEIVAKLGLIKDPAEGCTKWDSYSIHYDMRHQSATLIIEKILEAHHFNRYKKAFLEKYAYEFHGGYILPNNKIDEFLSSDLRPEKKEITLSVCQSRIQRIGSETIKYVAYRDSDGITICKKSDYFKLDHYGKYILIKVVRPEIMCGTIEEIEEDIKGIIYKELKDTEIIDFLR